MGHANTSEHAWSQRTACKVQLKPTSTLKTHKHPLFATTSPYRKTCPHSLRHTSYSRAESRAMLERFRYAHFHHACSQALLSKIILYMSTHLKSQLLRGQFETLYQLNITSAHDPSRVMLTTCASRSAFTSNLQGNRQAFR